MTDDPLSRRPAHALLADGTTVCIRPVRRADHEQLEGLHEEMSPEILRFTAGSTVWSRSSTGSPTGWTTPVSLPVSRRGTEAPTTGCRGSEHDL